MIAKVMNKLQEYQMINGKRFIKQYCRFEEKCHDKV